MPKLRLQSERMALGIVLVAVVAMVTLVVGARTVHNNGFYRLSASQKVESVSSDLRAPGDPSVVASSNFGMAFQIRSEVAADVSQGMSRAQILQAMVDEYGSNILAVPRFTGFGVLTWTVPILIAICILASVLWFVIRSVGRRVVGGRDDNGGRDEIGNNVRGVGQALRTSKLPPVQQHAGTGVERTSPQFQDYL